MARWIGADIVHVHAVGPALVVPFARLLGLKVVFTHHGPDYDRDKWCTAAKFVLRMGQFFGCLCANRVIVISEVIKQIIADSCGRNKRVHLIYNGVPEPEICHNAEYFRSLGIEEGNYILGMCRFVPEKHLHARDSENQIIMIFRAFRVLYSQEILISTMIILVP